MYSTLNIAVVVRDLTRLPTGAAVADDLRRAFAVGGDVLAALDATTAPAGAEQMRTRLRATAVQPAALDVLAGVRRAADVAGLTAWTSSLGALESAPMGRVDDLLRWLRIDVLAAGWDRAGDVAVARWPRGLDAVVDGVLAGLVAEADPDGHALAVPWRSWTAATAPRPLTDDAVAALVAGIRRSRPDDLAAAGMAVRAARADGWSWAAAMHDACWAVDLTGRADDAAVAQLVAVSALLSVTGPTPSLDVVAATTAAVHATVVADVLPADTLSAMCRPLLRRLG